MNRYLANIDHISVIGKVLLVIMDVIDIHKSILNLILHIVIHLILRTNEKNDNSSKYLTLSNCT